MKKPLWLVTGGAGFIGSNIVEELLRRGCRVRVFDNFSTGKKENLEPFKGKFELVKGDLRRPADLAKAMKGATYVLHQAAFRSVPKSVDNPMAAHDNNATGTLNALMAARAAGAPELSSTMSALAHFSSAGSWALARSRYCPLLQPRLRALASSVLAGAVRQTVNVKHSASPASNSRGVSTTAIFLGDLIIKE